MKSALRLWQKRPGIVSPAFTSSSMIQKSKTGFWRQRSPMFWIFAEKIVGEILSERLTTEEAAKEIGCRVQAVRENMRRGIWDLGSVVPIGGKKRKYNYYVFREKLNQFLGKTGEEERSEIHRISPAADRGGGDGHAEHDRIGSYGFGRIDSPAD